MTAGVGAASVDELRGRYGLAGLAAAVVFRDGPRRIYCSGSCEVGSGRPVDEATVFRIASITKTMTAIAVMQVRDQGVVGLDDPVNGYLRSFRIAPPPGGPDVWAGAGLSGTPGTCPASASALKIATEDGVAVVVLANTATVFGAPSSPTRRSDRS